MKGKGFTLIEVLVVAVIVAILASVAIPIYRVYIKDSRKAVALNIANSLAEVFNAYISRYPADEDGIPSGSFSEEEEVTVGSLGFSATQQKFMVQKGFNININTENHLLTVTSLDDTEVVVNAIYFIPD